jgi:hypothetical protein
VPLALADFVGVCHLRALNPIPGRSGFTSQLLRFVDFLLRCGRRCAESFCLLVSKHSVFKPALKQREVTGYVMRCRKTRVLTQCAFDKVPGDIELPKRQVGAGTKAHQVGIIGEPREPLIAGIRTRKRVAASQVCLRGRKQLALLVKRGNWCSPADRSRDAKRADISANVECNSNPEYLRVSGYEPNFAIV